MGGEGSSRDRALPKGDLSGSGEQILPDQDLVLHIPNLHESFERSQADVGIRGKGQGIAHRARGGHLGPDLGGGCQVPECQCPGHSPCDQALLIREQLAREDTIPRVLAGKNTCRQYTLLCCLTTLSLTDSPSPESPSGPGVLCLRRAMHFHPTP